MFSPVDSLQVLTSKCITIFPILLILELLLHAISWFENMSSDWNPPTTILTILPCQCVQVT